MHRPLWIWKYAGDSPLIFIEKQIFFVLDVVSQGDLSIICLGETVWPGGHCITCLGRLPSPSESLCNLYKGIGCFWSVSIHALLRYLTLAIQPHLTLCRRAGWPRWIWHAELNHSPMSSRNGCWDWKEFVMDENDMGYFRLMLCIIVFGLEKMIKWNNKTVKLDVCCVLEVFFFSCNCYCTGSVNQRSGAWKR